MKTNLLKRKKGRLDSSLFLRTFSLLALLVVGIGAWAQTSYGKAEISSAPNSFTAWQTITDQGNVKAWYQGTTDEYEFSANYGSNQLDGNWFVKLSNTGFIKIRVAKGTVVAGDILRVEVRDIYNNGTNQTLGFQVEGSNGTVGITENDNALHTLDYTLKANDIRVDSDDTNYDYIQFNRNGNSGCGYHSVEILRNILDASIFKTWSAIDGNSSTGTATCTNNLGSAVDAGGTVFGDGNVYYLNYVNVKGGSGAIMPDAKCLIIEGNAGVAVRILFNRVSDGGSNEEKNLTIPSDGKLIFDISSYDTFHLNAIKIPWNGSTGNVVNTIKLSNSLAGYTVGIKLDGLPSDCDAWFTLNGEATQYRTAQANVPVGTTVTYTMTSSDPHHSPNGWRTAAWADPDLGWMGPSAGFGSSAASFTTTVRAAAEGTANNEQRLFGNLNPWPEYTNNFMVYARVDGVGGTATVADANGHDMSTGYDCSQYSSNAGKTGSLTFTATPSAGYTFDGWYNSSGTKVSSALAYVYGEYSSVGTAVDFTLTAKFVPNIPEGTADFTDRGHGTNGSLSNGGVLTSTGTSDNWANIFVFPAANDDAHKNVTKTADEFSGLTIDAQGDNFRILVYYEGGAVAIKTQDCTNTKTTYRYSWTDLSVPFDKVSTITRVCVAGNKQQESATTTFSDARLLAEFHTVKFNALPSETSGKQGTARFTVEGSVNGEGNLIDRYPTASVENVMEGATINFYGSVADAYKNTHLVFWESDNAGVAYNNNFEFKMPASDVNVTLKIVEGARMHAGFVGNSAQPAGNGICFMQGGWNRGADALVYNGTGLTVTATAVAGYDFLGWYSNADGAEVNRLTTDLTYTADTGAGEHNYYAFYRKQGQVTLTYALNGGTGSLPASETVDAGKTINSIAAVNGVITKAGYGAKWWNTKADGTGVCYAPASDLDSDAKLSIVMNDDVVLYPFWRENPKYSASHVVVETGKTNHTYTYKVTGDGYGTVVLQKNDGNGNWTDCADNKDGDFTVTSDIRDGEKLPGWEVDVTVELTGIPQTESSDLYRLKLGHHSGHKYQYNDTYVAIYLGKPAGYHTINVTYDGQTKEREFLVHVPDGASGAVPVLFSLHGAANDYDSGVANYDNLANSEKFIVVYPRGNYHSIQPVSDNARSWLSTGKYNEDVKFFEDIIDWLNSHYMIDKNRVYMTGFSNGGMMTYSTAFTSDRFAGFAAVSGYPLNQFHLQHYGNGEWQGSHPVPFMHIHGQSDSFVPYADIQPIIDNMIYRNGCSFVPTTDKDIAAVDANGSIPATKKAHKTLFSNPIDANCQFVYYSVEGMGHDYECRIDANENSTAEWDDASQSIIWNFLKDKRRIDMADYNGRNRTEFMPRLEEAAPEYHVAHGWKRDVENNILWQYGDKPSKSLDGTHHQNVYHTIQLGSGFHNFKFKSSSSMSNTSTMWVTVRVEKLGKLGASGNTSTYTAIDKVVYEKDFNIGEVSFNINQEESEICEYRLTFEWHNSDETDRGIAAGKGIQISGVSILNNTGVDMGVVHTETHKEDFGGFFDFENRLIAQWNFDLCDGARFNRQSLGSNWVADNASIQNGVITYTYNAALNDEQLTYGNAPYNTLIPIAAGLKFKATAGQVKVQAYVEKGNLVRTQLVLEPTVQMYIPYVHNSFRNDKLNNGSAVSSATNKDDQFKDYMDCLHHINRDILYVSSSPDFFQAIINEHYYDGTNEKPSYTNDAVNTQNDFLFISGGAGERVKGAKVSLPEWEKLNYCGKQGDDCWVTIQQQVTIDRLAVNRNLVTSFYTENISIDTDQSRPFPGMRYIGSPAGNKVADAQTYTTYDKAIAMTFGGWEYNYNEYKDFNGGDVADSWGELNVYHGEGQGEGNQNYGIKDIDVTKVPLATDGFPVYSSNTNPAYSETLNPTASNNGLGKKGNGTDNQSYHDKNNGTFLLSTADGGTYDYIENLTPWSLPCRGGYVKFEPTYPGVLNVHILQEAWVDPEAVDKVPAEYYIADEFGRLVKNVFAKTGTGQTVSGTPGNGTPGHFTIGQKDNVKYVFDVYPGKSYYLFSNTAAGLGFTGFYFEPYVYTKKNGDGSPKELERDDIGIKTATLSDDKNYTGPNSMDWTDAVSWYSNQTASLAANDAKEHVEISKTENAAYISKYSGQSYYQPITYSNKAVHVSYRRNPSEGVGFAKGRWATICLPFSMNNLQLQEQFGDEVKVIMLRDVQNIDPVTRKRTANFIYHMNQDIIAGYPYLICPSKDVYTVQANVYVSDDVPSIISVNGIGQNTVTYPAGGYSEDYYVANRDYNYGGMNCYTFKGLFARETAPVGSYVISRNTGVLTLLTNGETSIKPFRAYMCHEHSTSTSGANCRIDATNFMDVEDLWETTDIEDVLLENGIVGTKTNVYSVNGTLIRQNTDDLRGLPKGMYIVNGKKYFVK